MLTLYVEAPFAVCRTFTAGWYRPTAAFLTPSAAYGLLLNLAGIETRLREEDESHPGTVPATLTRSGLPNVRIALGASAVRRLGNRSVHVCETDRYPRVQTVFQQLHNYPVGTSGNERSASAFGNKYNISPVRREILINLRAIVAIDGNSDLEGSLTKGLDGESPANRYGLPFVGDNSFLPDRIEVLGWAEPAHWYEKITGLDPEIRPRTTRMTICIDRANLSRTTSRLYAPTVVATTQIPENAWTEISPP